MEACLVVSRCLGVTVWGLDDGRSWMGPGAGALPSDAEGLPKPAAEAIRRSLQAAEGSAARSARSSDM